MIMKKILYACFINIASYGIAQAACTVPFSFDPNNMPPPSSGSHEACLAGCDALIAGATETVSYHSNIPDAEAETFAAEFATQNAIASLASYIRGADIKKTAYGSQRMSFHNKDGSFSKERLNEVEFQTKMEAIRGVKTIGYELDPQRSIYTVYVGVSLCSIDYASTFDRANQAAGQSQSYQVNPYNSPSQQVAPSSRPSKTWWSPSISQ